MSKRAKTADCACGAGKRPRHRNDAAPLPVGYCGRCALCGRPGHRRPHPITGQEGAWCDRHWRALNRDGVDPTNLALLLVTSVAVLGFPLWVIWRFFF